MIRNPFDISSYILSRKLLDTCLQSFFFAGTACDFFPQFPNSSENVNSQEAVCCYADDEYTKDNFKAVHHKIVYGFCHASPRFRKSFDECDFGHHAKQRVCLDRTLYTHFVSNCSSLSDDLAVRFH